MNKLMLAIFMKGNFKMNDTITAIKQILDSYYQKNVFNKEVAEVIYNEFIVGLEEDAEYWRYEALEQYDYDI